MLKMKYKKSALRRRCNITRNKEDNKDMALDNLNKKIMAWNLMIETSPKQREIKF